MFESQKGKNLAAVIFKVNVIMNHQCEGLGFFFFFFLFDFLSFALSVSGQLLREGRNTQIQMH